MNKYQQKHIITLSNRERAHLQSITRKGKHQILVIKHARVLLASARGDTDKHIASRVELCVRTVENIRARFATGGLPRALYDAPRPGQPSKLNDKAEARLIALACSDPPEGRHHWTLELLQKRMITDKQVKTISTVALWQRLKQRGIKPWREKNVVRSHAYG